MRIMLDILGRYTLSCQYQKNKLKKCAFVQQIENQLTEQNVIRVVKISVIANL